VWNAHIFFDYWVAWSTPNLCVSIDVVLDDKYVVITSLFTSYNYYIFINQIIVTCLFRLMSTLYIEHIKNNKNKRKDAVTINITINNW